MSAKMTGSDFATLLLFILGVAAVLAQNGHNGHSACEQTSCYPATGDLLIGREKNLFASSTCGLNNIERYCIVSHLEDKKKCFACDSRRPYEAKFNTRSHRVENIVSTFRGAWKSKWWQAKNGVENVYIQLDLGSEFHFTHLVMRFKTFRPAAMLLERSYDFGKTWKVYRYFAYDCDASFPGIPHGPIRSVADVICESRYSDVAPSTEGEVIFRVLPQNIEIEDPYSEEVQDMLKMTNLRINFTRLHTLGDDLLDNRDEIKEKYYYSVYDMVVRGSCSCYGHAARCLPLEGHEDNPNMVHGRCECTHNTKGLNCEQCDDFYNDLPWRPARNHETNACKQCECHGHAVRCHFDPAVFEATERVSGGVCDDCQHNTVGRNCEECKPFYYHDPNLPIDDPDTCKHCECDPLGSEHGGECESHTDPEHNLVAGRCLCKTYVEGARCDTCMNGFWNLQAENPDGCEQCSCDTTGTIGNFGCDKRTGDCRCKRFVAGRDCNECRNGYWGLSEEPDGCKPCDCDPGGAYDNQCDKDSGQCHCRPNVIGRRCDQVNPGYFVPTITHLKYEAEDCQGSGRTEVVQRERDNSKPCTWSGTGFMKAHESAKLEFTVNDIPFSTEYNIVIRYEPTTNLRWDEARVTVVRPGLPDRDGACANSIPQDDIKTTALPQGMRQHEVFPSSCLEKGVEYTIVVDLVRYKSGRVNNQANILIDSIVLVPSGHSIPIFDDPTRGGDQLRREFERNRCRDGLMNMDPLQEPPEVCAKFNFSIGASIYDGAQECGCDETGSYSHICEPIGGQCDCKPNVIGRRCDMCAPGTYGLGPEGCQPCECNAIGTVDRSGICDPTTGDCPCNSNVFGRQCNECQKGFYDFPRCRQCQCNGRADECENDTGFCLICRDNTGGNNCERCAEGFYGDPRPGSRIGCKPCMCPGGAGSGVQHADSCKLDTATEDVVCDCHPGYKGLRCDQCEENYFGNPLEVGGSCEQCECNGNIDHSEPDSCDAATGECLKCLHNTEGFYCEQCKLGYYGDAASQNCISCICNKLGTNRTVGLDACDRETGQCPCLPNVLGQRCDQCAENHWKIASGLGCEPCDCDPEGSRDAQCHEFDGQCICNAGRGGRTCSDCPDFFWGDPETECTPCDCHSGGSVELQCDRATGQCPCQPGVTGMKCDRCDRGTTGELPNCKPCGECYKNWETIISNLHNETLKLVLDIGNLKITGAPGAFDKEFKEMESKLEEVKKLVSGVNVTGEDFDYIQRQLTEIRLNLTSQSSTLDVFIDGELANTTRRIEIAYSRIDTIRIHLDSLKTLAEQLKANATTVRELDVSGAFNSIKDSQRRSEAAQKKASDSANNIQESERVRLETEETISKGRADFDHDSEINEQTLQALDSSADNITRRLVDLNDQVCDGLGDPCNSICGGAMCGRCGGIGCEDGAVTKASNALELSKKSEIILQEKLTEATRVQREVSIAEEDANKAKQEAQIAYDLVLLAKNQSESTKEDLQKLLDRITEFLLVKGARPVDIREVAEEVLAMTISLNPEQIRELAIQINETIRGLTDIDAILDATREDLENANRLKDRANKAQADADEALRTAERVIEALKKAKEAQDLASTAIDKANLDITETENFLAQIESENAVSVTKSNSTLVLIVDLRSRLEILKRKFLENEINVKKAEREAENADELANNAQQAAGTLTREYEVVTVELETKYNETVTVRSRAVTLQLTAKKIYDSTIEKISRLRVMESEFTKQEKVMLDLSAEFAQLNIQMNRYLVDIRAVAEKHRTCRP